MVYRSYAVGGALSAMLIVAPARAQSAPSAAPSAPDGGQGRGELTASIGPGRGDGGAYASVARTAVRAEYGRYLTRRVALGLALDVFGSGATRLCADDAACVQYPGATGLLLNLTGAIGPDADRPVAWVSAGTGPFWLRSRDDRDRERLHGVQTALDLGVVRRDPLTLTVGTRATWLPGSDMPDLWLLPVTVGFRVR